MVDTVRSLAALQALLADNTSGDISPQDVRDMLVSVYPSQLGYAEITASQTGITTIVDIAGLAVTVTPTVNRRVKVSCHCVGFTSSVTGDRGQMLIREGSTTLARSIRRYESTSTEDGGPVMWVGTATAGSHTYKISYERVSGTGTHVWVAAADAPSFILVEDLGDA